jgi:hypothetical protein
MSVWSADIDLDLPTGTDIRQLFPTCIPASRVDDESELVKHPCGYYFENIAIDPLTQLAAIPHKEAGDIGYTKIDFLSLSLLNAFDTKTDFRKACRKQPNWTLLTDRSIVAQLFQVKNHYDLIQKISPTSVQELADAVALIRPDKRLLLNDYLRNRQKIRPMLYRSLTDDKSAFRKGHAISCAITIVAQLNLLSYCTGG